MAIPLKDKPDVIPPNLVNEFGDIEDFNLGVVPGTPFNRLVYSDLHQFFEKLMSFAGKNHNNVSDNSSNGYQLFDSLLDLIQKQLAPTVFTDRVNLQNAAHYEAVYGLGKFRMVTSGANNMIESFDGINWTQGTNPSASPLGITYGNGVLLVNDTLNVSNVSTDGVNWSVGTAFPFTVSNVVFLNGQFFALRNAPDVSSIATSVDGSAWTSLVTPNTVRPIDIVFGGGTYVAVGTSGGMLTSTDGINWIVPVLPVVRVFFSVTYGNGVFVALSLDSGFFTTSTDGITWVDNASPIGANKWLDITFGRGRFVAVSISGGTDRAAVSVDGVSWTVLLTNTNDWGTITYNDGLFVAGSNNGAGDQIMTAN